MKHDENDKIPPSMRYYGTGIVYDRAVIGSERLYSAMRKQFLRLAVEKGVTVKDATLLLMNAVPLGRANA